MKGIFTKPVAKHAAGFSLVELMIVVSIIGILAALAVPRFTKFQAKARQSEAKTNLAHIYTLQQSYHGEEDEYSAFSRPVNKTDCNETNIGFVLNGCKKARYEYSMPTATATTFVANAIAAADIIVPGCTKQDEWELNQNKDLKAVEDSVKSCT